MVLCYVTFRRGLLPTSKLAGKGEVKNTRQNAQPSAKLLTLVRMDKIMTSGSRFSTRQSGYYTNKVLTDVAHSCLSCLFGERRPTKDFHSKIEVEILQ